MGTPEFSVPALKELINSCKTNSDYELVCVYTRRPKEAGRGQKIQYSPIYKITEENNIQIFTPKNLRNEKNQEEFKKLNIDVAVVVAYGLIIPEEVINMTKYGFINIHPSLLPKWRGSAPMQRCLLSNDEYTGVCIMKLDAGMDTGDIIKVSDKIKIDKNVDIEYLHDNLSVMGAKMLIEVLEDIKNNNGNIKTYKQDDNLATIAPKIEKEEGIIDFNNSSVEYIDKQIRALWVFPSVYFNHNGNRIKILKADFEKNNNAKYPLGSIINDKFHIQCKDGILKPLIVQKEVKNPMDIKSFLNGYKI